MKAPPLLPEETLRRVARIARFDGISVTAIAGVFALLSAAGHDVSGAVVGVIVAGAGAVELHGVTLLHAGEPRAMRWLIGSQFYLLAAILGYVAWRLGSPDPLMIDAMRKALTSDQRQVLKENGVTEAEFLQMMMRLVYFSVGLATMIYQGSMATYYVRRRAAVLRALEPEI